ncbi:MAG: hypothetical protein AAF394_03560, partial [Planctomycetota bacterium]
KQSHRLVADFQPYSMSVVHSFSILDADLSLYLKSGEVPFRVVADPRELKNQTKPEAPSIP